jgi:hypothetical protein
MTLDDRPSDAQLARMKAEREAKGTSSIIVRAPSIVPGPNSLAHIATRPDPASRKTERKRSEQREHSAQSELFEWAWSADALARYPELESMYAVPNAGQRSKRAGYEMKREGLVKGHPDVCLPTPRRNPVPGPIRVFGSCMLEMKDLKGTLRHSQIKRIELLKRVGNFVDVALSCTAGQALLLYYLSLDRP